jgi:hypothetical protein
MADTQDMNQREISMLEALDKIESPAAWAELVRYMAPQLAEDNNKLLAEIVIRKALRRIEDRKRHDPTAKIDVAEMIACEFGIVGLRLVPNT